MGGMVVNGVPEPDWVRNYKANADAKQRADDAALSAGTRNVNTASDVSLRGADLADRKQAFDEEQTRSRQAALAAIAAQIQQGTGYSPSGGAPAPGTLGPSADPTQPSPEDIASENASYGRAKERTGLSLQSALKGLHGAMASRGVSGSGIEAGNMASLFSGGVGELADTDRQLAETGATRAFTRNQSALDRNERAREYDSDAQARKISQLLSVYGSMY